MALADLRSELRQAGRALRRQPGLSLVAVVSLAVAIGANATIFGLVDGVLFRPLPGERGTPLVSVFTSESDGNGFGTTSFPAYLDLRARDGLFTHVSAMALTPLLLADGERSEKALGMMVSGDWFATLGARAALGRVIQPSDDRRPGESPVVVLSDAFWRRRFAADPGVVGRELRLNGHPWTVVGVLPPEFRGVFLGLTPDLYVPTRMEAWAQPGRSDLANRGGRSYMVVGRLAGGLSLAQAQARLDALAAELGREHPASDSGRAFLVTREEDSRPIPQVRPMLAVFLGLLQVITGLVLVIACVNLAGLLLARGSERRREIGVRLALGATRARLVRMLVSESLILGVVGTGLGLVLATLGARALAAFRPPLPVPVTLDFQPDGRVAVFAVLLGLVSVVVFSLVPAWQTVSPALTGPLADDLGARRSRLRRLLMVTQVALSLVLLAGAGLFLRALERARTLDPGFEPRGVTAVEFDPSLSGFDLARTRAFYARLLEEARALPGVTSVALTEQVPLGLAWSEAGMWLPPGDREASERSLDMPVNAVTEGYFATLRIPIVKGRALRTGQVAGEVVVNESFAKRFWPGQDPIGRRVGLEGSSGPWRTVVGVAADARYRSIAESPMPFLYVAADHDGDDDGTLLVRTSAPAATVAPALRALIRRLAPDLAPAQPEPLERLIGASLVPGRLAGGVLAATGAVALALACLGLYAVVAYSVSRRTKEIGVRVALGARPRDILALVMSEGSRLLAWGLGVGLLLAVAAGFVLRGLLYGLSPLDLPAHLGVILLLGLTALVACWLPARRATAVNPVVALRHE
jgi:predicted permease